MTKFFIEITRNVYSIETYNEILLNTTFYFIERGIIANVYIETCVIQICVCRVDFLVKNYAIAHNLLIFLSKKVQHIFKSHQPYNFDSKCSQQN